MMTERQTTGREDNAAVAGGKPEAATSEGDVKRVGKKSTRSAGPDGPKAEEVGKTFKS